MSYISARVLHLKLTFSLIKEKPIFPVSVVRESVYENHQRDTEKMNRDILNIKDEGVAQK